MRRAAELLARLRALLGSRHDSWDWPSEGHALCGDLSVELTGPGNSACRALCQTLRHVFGHLRACEANADGEIVLAATKLIQLMETWVSGAGTGSATEGAQVARMEVAAAAPAGSPAPGAPATVSPRTAAHRADGWVSEDTVRLVNETRLGELLVRSGCIDDDTLAKALDLQQVGAKRLGDVLVGMGKITSEELQGMLMQQRELTLRLASGWWSGGGALRLSSGQSSGKPAR